jgi:hypothetical protein
MPEVTCGKCKNKYLLLNPLNDYLDKNHEFHCVACGALLFSIIPEKQDGITR